MAFLKYAFQKRLHLLRLDQILTRKLLFIERVPLDARQEHGQDVGGRPDGMGVHLDPDPGLTNNPTVLQKGQK